MPRGDIKRERQRDGEKSETGVSDAQCLVSVYVRCPTTTASPILRATLRNVPRCDCAGALVSIGVIRCSKTRFSLLSFIFFLSFVFLSIVYKLVRPLFVLITMTLPSFFPSLSSYRYLHSPRSRSQLSQSAFPSPHYYLSFIRISFIHRIPRLHRRRLSLSLLR